MSDDKLKAWLQEQVQAGRVWHGTNPSVPKTADGSDVYLYTFACEKQVLREMNPFKSNGIEHHKTEAHGKAVVIVEAGNIENLSQPQQVSIEKGLQAFLDRVAEMKANKDVLKDATGIETTPVIYVPNDGDGAVYYGWSFPMARKEDVESTIARANEMVGEQVFEFSGVSGVESGMRMKEAAIKTIKSVDRQSLSKLIVDGIRGANATGVRFTSAHDLPPH